MIEVNSPEWEAWVKSLNIPDAEWERAKKWAKEVVAERRFEVRPLIEWDEQ